MLASERPRRIAFTLSVEKYSRDTDTVTIEITRLGKGCVVTLTHEMKAKYAPFQDRAREGWTGILDVAAEILVDEAPTCGIGLAQHATIPAKIGVMFEGLAETLELHRQMRVLDAANSRKEGEVYRELAASWKDIAQQVAKRAAHMAAQHELPMGAHDQSGWGEAHLKAFEKFVKAQTQVLAPGISFVVAPGGYAAIAVSNGNTDLSHSGVTTSTPQVKLSASSGIEPGITM